MEVSPFAIVYFGTKIFFRCSEVSVNGGSTVTRKQKVWDGPKSFRQQRKRKFLRPCSSYRWKMLPL